MEKIIYIENETIKKCNSLQELYEFIFGKYYFNLTEKEKFIRRYESVFYKIKFYGLNLDIVHTQMGVLGEEYKIINKKYDLNNSFVIDNEREFVISLSKIPNITILENKQGNYLLQEEEKQKYKGNYIIINNIL